jgi:hypothetical protein
VHTRNQPSHCSVVTLGPIVSLLGRSSARRRATHCGALKPTTATLVCCTAVRRTPLIAAAARVESVRCTQLPTYVACVHTAASTVVLCVALRCVALLCVGRRVAVCALGLSLRDNGSDDESSSDGATASFGLSDVYASQVPIVTA